MKWTANLFLLHVESNPGSPSMIAIFVSYEQYWSILQQHHVRVNNIFKNSFYSFVVVLKFIVRIKLSCQPF